MVNPEWPQLWGEKIQFALDGSVSGRRGVVVTRLIRSAKLLYAGPG